MFRQRPDNPQNSPFELENTQAYSGWRDEKLSRISNASVKNKIAIAPDGKLDENAEEKLKTLCQETNFACFKFTAKPENTRLAITRLGNQLGLANLDQNLCADEDAISVLSVKDTNTDKTYIPYTNRPLSWHTDGYYNPESKQIRAWLLYCEQDAMEGGENQWIDHEIIYIWLRDENPKYIQALMAADALTIPPNEEQGLEIRGSQTGPVFSVGPDGYLHMRFSARSRNISWKNDPLTKKAVERINELLLSKDNLALYEYKLNPGEGIISNNILHRREGFRDDIAAGRKRIMYRARYSDRIQAPTPGKL